jgi:ABC-type polysaccharide/polyol phosphate transport system ATPase subunit
MENKIIEVNAVWKKYCKSLKLSLLYGCSDLLNEITLKGSASEVLRNKEFWVLKDISFSLLQGQMLGLVGVNGAGKSTMLKLINGLIKPNRGTIKIYGRVGALIELGTGFNPNLSGYENIFINGVVLGLKYKEIKSKLDEIIAFSELGDFIKAPVKTYSSGMLARLGFSVAVHINPDILLVDEILSVGDIGFKDKSFNKLMEYRKGGGSIILVSHSNTIIESYCDQAVLLDSGNLLGVGKPAHIISKYAELVRKKKVINSISTNVYSETDDVIIKNCFCSDRDGNYRDSFEFEEPISIVFDYAIVKPLSTIPDFLIEIRDSDTSFTWVNFNTRWRGLETDSIPQEGRIICNIQAPSFSKGAYEIVIACQAKISSQIGKKWYSELRKYNQFLISTDAIYKKLPGLMNSEYNRLGHIYMEHDWELVTEKISN